MKTIETREIMSVREILHTECQERLFKEINLEIFSNGNHFIANRLCMYFRVPTNEYMIVLHTNNGFLVNTVLDSHHANSEFSYLVASNDAEKGSAPITINSYSYINDSNLAGETKMPGYFQHI